MTDKITREKTFNHPIDKVWKAITDEKEIGTWFIKADFKPEVGYKYTFTAPEEQNCTQISGEVKEATPYTLVYTWVMQNTDVETTVTWKLEQLENGTKLFLEHSGISNYTGEVATKMFDSYSGGWDNCISELSKYLTELTHAS